LEILCWRLKERERWDDYMSYEEAINKHLQNMHPGIEAAHEKRIKDTDNFLFVTVVWRTVKHLKSD
jgi:hypothetical protein